MSLPSSFNDATTAFTCYREDEMKIRKWLKKHFAEIDPDMARRRNGQLFAERVVFRASSSDGYASMQEKVARFHAFLADIPGAKPSA